MSARGGAVALIALTSALMPTPGAGQWLDFDVPDRPVADEAMAEDGRDVFLDRCWFCHGEDGDGEGPVAQYLWPRPRDFTIASFKLRTTGSGELPTDEDLYRTISLGIPGTSMPEWGSTLSEDERWQVIAYIKTFGDGLFEDEAFDPYNAITELGTPPDASEEDLVESGRGVFDEADCWECHGQMGRGDGEKAPELEDDWGFPLLPRNLRLGWTYKGGRSVEEIYLRLSTGMDATPMPSYALTLSEDERWQLASYVASLQDEGEEGDGAGAVIGATRVDGQLPSSPDDPAWDEAEEVSLPLTGQATFRPRWQIPAVTDLTVQALYDDSEVALRLAWADRFADTTRADTAAAAEEGWSADDSYPALYPDTRRVRGTFSDAVEVMLPVRNEGGPVLPHFVYGSAGQPVDLWRWRAEEQFATPSGPPVTELRAGGAQRPPEPHGPESQLVSGTGTWEAGRWTVVIRRPLQTETGSEETQLAAGQYVPVAFHVWDGNNGETGLRMAVSSWYFLHLREPVPIVSYGLVLLIMAAAGVVQFGVVRLMSAKAEAGGLAEYGLGQGGVEAR